MQFQTMIYMRYSYNIVFAQYILWTYKFDHDISLYVICWEIRIHFIIWLVSLSFDILFLSFCVSNQKPHGHRNIFFIPFKTERIMSRNIAACRSKIPASQKFRASRFKTPRFGFVAMHRKVDFPFLPNQSKSEWNHHFPIDLSPNWISFESKSKWNS